MGTLLIAMVAVAAMSVLALPTVDDLHDVAIRAARTFVQTGLGLALTVLAAPGIDADIGLNVIAPAIVAGATVIHGAIQPAERKP